MHTKDDFSPAQAPGADPYSIPRLGAEAPDAAPARSFTPPSADTPSGALSFAIPLPDATARGANPALSLVYSSAAGNGLFGMGWSLPVSFIGLHLREGLPLYDGHDTYMLDGGDDLVVVHDGDAAGSALWQEDVTLAGIAYRVHRFRPRIDASLSLIERYTRQNDGDVHWRVLDGDGTQRVYGQSASARVADPAHPKRIWRWCLERVATLDGNLIAYEYTPENALGRAAVGGSNQHLKAVRFGALSPFDTQTATIPDFAYHLVFDFGDHAGDTPTPVPDAVWPARGDCLSDRRAGFELRTNRLCRRVLFFTDLPELGAGPTLTEALELEYELAHGISRLVRAQSVAYQRNASGGYAHAYRPDMTLQYSGFAHDSQPRPLPEANTGVLPGLTEGPGCAARLWADLLGTGLPGILSQDGATLRFAPNQGAGRFGPATPLAQTPLGGAIYDATLTLAPVDRSGRVALILRSGTVAGFFDLDETGAAQPFRPFESQPNTQGSPSSPLLTLDATGNGYTDLLDLESDPPRLAEGQGKKGIGPLRDIDSAQHPCIRANGQTRALLLADMTGDGLSDLVEVAADRVVYWPALGHGRFDKPVEMTDVPDFCAPDGFDPARVRLASLSGAGAAALVYFGQDRITYALNPVGRRFIEARTLPGTERTLGGAGQVLDLLGQGVPSLLLPATGSEGARYLSPAGDLRPHLLVALASSLGAETRVRYASSAQLAAQALAAGRPWRATTPFSVICVTRIEQIDHLRKRTQTQRLDYAHACFDPVDRDFCGFARVDHWDGSEEEEARGAAPNRPPEAQPVLHTRSWYDTGQPRAHPLSPEALAAEWWTGGGADLRFRPAIPRLPATAPEAQLRRARRGQLLRRETYARDGHGDASLPLSTQTLTTAAFCCAPAKGVSRPAVVRAVPASDILVTWERSTTDPHVTQSTVLAHDEQGHVTRAASLVYGRRVSDPSLPLDVRAGQARTLVDIADSTLTNDTLPSAAWRHLLRRRVWRTESWVLQGVTAPADSLFTAHGLQMLFGAAPQIGVEAPTGTSLAKRQTGETRHRFITQDLAQELPEGVLGRLPIIQRSFDLAFTSGQRVSAWQGGFVTDSDLAAAGYIDLDNDGGWWRPSGVLIRGIGARARFLQPLGTIDAAGVQITYDHDPYSLFVTVMTDSLGNQRISEIDYRLGRPFRTTDPNGTITEAAFDVQGRIVAQAVRGPMAEGDRLDQPTLTISYDDTAFALHGRPNSRRMRMRETHGDPATRWYERVSYLDGTGAVMQDRAQALPGLADSLSTDGQLRQTDTGAVPRWRVSSRARLSQKAAVIGAFDPWFAPDDAFEDAPALTERGGTTVTWLDATGQTERTDFADGTFATSNQTPWHVVMADRNDTVRDSQWYFDRGSPDPAGAEPADEDAFAAWASAKHHGTTGATYLDPGGAAIFERAPLGDGRAQLMRLARVPGGHVVQSFDSAGREGLAQYFDLLGRMMRSRNIEDGDTLIFFDAAGRAIRNLRPDGTLHDILHDALGRPLGVRSTAPGDATSQLVSLTLYGDGHPDADTENLRSRVMAILDGSGMMRIRAYDFRGLVTFAEKSVLADPLNAPDYSALLGVDPVQALAMAEALMTPERFTSSTRFDAMGRATHSTMPDGAQIAQRHALDGTLDALRLTPIAGGAARDVLRGQEVDAWGAVIRTQLGDGTTIRNEIDPLMRRVWRRVVTRDLDGRALMDVSYSHDACGHISGLHDAAARQLFFANDVIDGAQRFEYDALYRLRRVTGRELAALSNSPWAQETGVSLPHANDTSALRRFTRRFTYDIHGNLTEIHHSAGASQWRRRMQFAASSNRLEAISQPGDAENVYSLAISHDAQGRMTGGAGLGPLSWSSGGQLRRLDLGGGGVAHYIFGAGGGRVRKIIERPGGLRDDWIYLGSVEIYRRTRNGVLQEERMTHKVMSEGRLLLRVESTFSTTTSGPAQAAPLWRFRHEDVTGLVTLETTETGALILSETFHPFGTTAYRSATAQSEASLSRYRYASRETDSESGLVLMGHRFYAPWFGRWISPDPAGPVDGANLYAYCGNNPVSRSDRGGMQSDDDALAATRERASNWSFQELQEAVRLIGGTLHPIVTEQNYREYWNGQQWRVLAGDDLASGSEAAGGGGDDTEPATQDQPPPGNANESDNAASGGDAQGGDATPRTDADSEEDSVPSPQTDSGSDTGTDSGTTPSEPADDAGENSQNLAGAAAVSSYNSWLRAGYSNGNVQNAIKAVATVEDAIARGDSGAAWNAAQEASERRNQSRVTTQRRMRWTGGEQLSRLVEVERPFHKTTAHYGTGANRPMTPMQTRAWNLFTPGLPHHTPGPRGSGWQQITRDIAIGTGKTNRVMSAFSKFGKAAGPLGTVVGVGIGFNNYRNAPPEEKSRVAIGETASFVGGAVGFAAGSAGAALLIGFFVSNPVGWVAGAVTITVFALGAIAAYAGAALFRWAAESSYDYATGP